MTLARHSAMRGKGLAVMEVGRMDDATTMSSATDCGRSGTPTDHGPRVALARSRPQ